MSGIELIQIGHVLERLHADATISVEKAFAVLAQHQIGLHYALHSGADLVFAEARPHDVADAGIFGAGAAELELVILDALLVDAQDADVAGVMVAAGVDAARDLDLELADVVLAIEVGEALGDILRNRDRARIGEIAIVETRAGDDVGDKAGVRRRQAMLAELGEDRRQVALLHVRQYEILLVADADF